VKPKVEKTEKNGNVKGTKKPPDQGHFRKPRGNPYLPMAPVLQKKGTGWSTLFQQKAGGSFKRSILRG
jgi:hypothetical protein